MEPNHVYQYSIINALMAGVADSGVTVSEYIKKGNHGIGTFTNIQGELVLLDDTVYQLQSDGVRTAEQDEELPYAVATKFVPQNTQMVVLASKHTVDDLLQSFNNRAANLFMSFRIEGTFKSLQCRTVEGQEYEGQSLAELGHKQSVHTYNDIEGVIVGYRAPEAWQGFFVAGIHMHFIDKERKIGGHVLELRSVEKLKFSMATVNDIHIELPVSEKFNTAKMSTDDSGLRSIEG